MSKILQSWARDTFIASGQRQRDNVTELQKQEKSRKNFKVVVSKWTSRSKYCNIVILQKPTTCRGSVVACPALLILLGAETPALGGGLPAARTPR